MAGNLSLQLDASLPILNEPGFSRVIRSREMSSRANPKDDTGPKGLWADPETRTIMLMPLQLRADWLNTTNQLSRVIRLSAMTVNAADLSAGRVFEQPLAGNTANPYIYHVPVGPAAAFPSGSGGPPTLTGLLMSYAGPAGLALALGSVFKQLLFESPTTMPAGAPAPVVAGTTDETKYICQTADLLDANQGVYLRWHQPPAQLNFHAFYTFFIGQIALVVKATMVEVYADTSPHGDRTAWQKMTVHPLFTFDDVAAEPGFLARWLSHTTVSEQPAHDRGLLFLPFRRNQILLYSSAGKSAVVQVNGRPKRSADNAIWEITRSDSLAVRVQTPAPGRFQIQKVEFLTGGVTFQSPHIFSMYTPSTPPTVTVSEDSDNTTSVVAVRTQDPTTYTLPKPLADPCPSEVTGTSSQRALFGVEVTLNASSAGSWTPFFYGLKVTALPTFQASAAVPESIDDTSPGSVIRSAKITGGDKPGDGRMTVEVLDQPAFPLADKYYRSGYPITLARDGVTLFTGITRPQEITPLKQSLTRPRRIAFSARDMWQRLEETYPAEETDWTGVGHISVVLHFMQLCGIDTTNAIVPANTLQWNTPLGGVNTDEKSAAEESGDLQPGWQKQAKESAAGFIKHIAENYSGWLVGFLPDGRPYYFPRWVTPGVPFFPTPAVTFQSSSAGSPRFSSATFTTEEPEAIVIAVEAKNGTDGGVTRSPVMVDWAAFRNPNAPNFVGRWKAEYVKIRGSYSCAQLAWIARKIWERTRRRRVIATFDADFLDAVPGVGSVVTLGSYGNYMVSGFDLQLQHKGNLSGRFTADLVERGF